MGSNSLQIEIKGLNLLSNSSQIATLVAEHEKRIAPMRKWAQEQEKRLKSIPDWAQKVNAQLQRAFESLKDKTKSKFKSIFKRVLKPSFPIPKIPNPKNPQPYKPKLLDKLNLELLFTKSLKLHAPPAICRNSNRQAAGLTL